MAGNCCIISGTELRLMTILEHSHILISNFGSITETIKFWWIKKLKIIIHFVLSILKKVEALITGLHLTKTLDYQKIQLFWDILWNKQLLLGCNLQLSKLHIYPSIGWKLNFTMNSQCQPPNMKKEDLHQSIKLAIISD